MFCCISRYIHNTFSKYSEHEKTVFIYINVFLSEPPFNWNTPPINNWYFCWTPPNCSEPPPSPILPTYLALKTMFFKIRVFLVITGYRKKKRNVRFLVWCAGVVVCGRLLVVSLLVVFSRLLVVCGRLWWFAVVCGRCLFW